MSPSSQKNYFKELHDELGSDFIDPQFLTRLSNVCKFSIHSLTALGAEMFRLTSDTRGGLFLMLVFFYFSYLFGAMFYVETRRLYLVSKDDNNWTSACSSVGECMYTMMRLTFWDGTGMTITKYL